MADKKRMGRPPSDNPKPPTTMIRVPPDLAVMLSEVCRLHGVTAATMVDQLLRKQIEAKFAGIRPHLEQLAKVSKEAKRRLESVDEAIAAMRKFYGE